MHRVSAGMSHLKDFSGASGMFSQRAMPHGTLVGTRAMGKGGGRGSLFPMSSWGRVVVVVVVDGGGGGGRGRGRGKEQRAQTFLCQLLTAECP